MATPSCDIDAGRSQPGAGRGHSHPPGHHGGGLAWLAAGRAEPPAGLAGRRGAQLRIGLVINPALCGETALAACDWVRMVQTSDLAGYRLSRWRQRPVDAPDP